MHKPPNVYISLAGDFPTLAPRPGISQNGGGSTVIDQTFQERLRRAYMRVPY